jgi:hypothetical protein
MNVNRKRQSLITNFAQTKNVTKSKCTNVFYLLLCRKGSIQGEIKISTEDGESRILRSLPDWEVS